MSIQPLSLALPPIEAPARRRAPEAAAEREEIFALPEEPVARAERPEPRRPDARTPDDDAKPVAEKPASDSRPAAESKAAAESKTSAQSKPSGDSKTAVESKPSGAPAAAPGKPGEPGAAPATQPAVTIAQQDAGAMVSIAVAAQAQAGETDASKDKDKSIEAKSAAEKEAGGKLSEGGVVLPLAIEIVPAAAPQPAILSPEALLLAAAGANAAPEASGATQPQSAGVPVTATAAAVAGAGGLQAQLTASAIAAKPDGVGPGAEAHKSEAKGDKKTEADGQASALPSSAAGDGASSPATAFKPPEASQPPLNPIDLSAMFAPQRGNAKAELTALAGPDATATAAQATAQAQTEASGSPVAMHVVPLEIGLRALSGAKRFEIRLDPAELGRVDVKLDISDTGEVSAKLVVDRVETLHMLQRDARTLERAFEQAGLKPSDAGVDITLRDPSDQSGFRQNRQDDEAPRRARRPGGGADNDDITITAQPAPVRRLLRLGGVDLSI